MLHSLQQRQQLVHNGGALLTAQFVLLEITKQKTEFLNLRTVAVIISTQQLNAHPGSFYMLNSFRLSIDLQPSPHFRGAELVSRSVVAAAFPFEL